MVNLQNYITDSKLFKTFVVDDLLVVEYKCLVDDHESDIWTHDNYFAYVLGGEKKWKTPVREFRAGNGDILFVRKGSNTVYQYFEQPFVVIFVFVSDNFIRKILAKYPALIRRKQSNAGGNYSLIPLQSNNILTSCFESITLLFSQPSAPQKEILKIKTEELILHLLTQPGNSYMKEFFTYLLKDNKIDMQEIMTTNYTSQLTINEYARLCGRSLTSFRRDFSKDFGTTPGKWILARRLELSRFLLETTNERVSDIAYTAGFRNRSHFNKVFKEANGTSPNEYRHHLTAAL